MGAIRADVGLSGGLALRTITRADRDRADRRLARAWRVRTFFAQRWREVPLEILLLACRGLNRVVPGFNVPLHGRLHLTLVRADGRTVELGCAGCHLVVTAGKNYVASTFNNVAEPELLKFHGYGTGATAAALADTALQTELTTQYATDNTRPTGTQANSTNTYTTVGTLSPDATVAITEWGLFTATSAGTLLDRQTFSAVNLTGSADSLQTTYVLTIS